MKAKTLLLGVAVGVCLNAAVVFVIMGGMIHVKAACPGPAGTPCGNGDVNGSGGIDIADTVYLLSYLFANGKEPVAFADGGGLTPEQEEILSHFSIVRLPDGKGSTTKTIRLTGVNLQIVNGTDNTEVQNGVGNLIVGYNELRAWPFDTENDRTGSHNVVLGTMNNYQNIGGLIVGVWNTISGKWSTVTAGSYNIASGLNSSISGGSLNGATGEVSSVAGGKGGSASGFESFVGGGQGNSANGQYSVVCGGHDTTAEKDHEVLGDTFSLPRFVDNGDGTVTDKRTGLMWQKDTDATKRKWIDARSYCESLALAQHSNWRMPSYAELESILDETRSNPAIDPVFEAMSDWYWSSSAFTSSGTAWIVGFNIGGAGSGGVDVPGYVRAVRDAR
jgi:hypothetical protein